MASVTEVDSLQEFLSTAQLAGTEFRAEKLNVKYVDPKTEIGLVSNEERAELLKAHNSNQELLKIPRRPKWDENTSGAELKTKENHEFLEWRRQLALIQEEKNLTMTPYEKNLEFWRQLWRVVERSDVIVQIVDARNPLLFRCEDLEKYVKEIDENKQNMILINKADFLTIEQRQEWVNYFNKSGMRIAFFSALESAIKNADDKLNEELDKLNVEQVENNDLQSFDVNSDELMSKERLIALFKSMKDEKKDLITIGLVGYPNVGKSSTINAILDDKKVSVSATPGKTKHFQTLFVDKELMLCDCPGLVMPSFVCTKAEMILHGILPIDQLRDHVPAVSLLGILIPRHILEDTYGIMLPPPIDGEDPDRPPTSEEILNTYGYNRGYMTQNGQPDNPRSARYLLKDYVNGKLLYCLAPPDIEQNKFHIFPPRSKIISENRVLPPRAIRAGRGVVVNNEDLDKTFFQNNSSGIHVRGGIHNNPPSNSTVVDKPWKKENKHANKKKREKTRRLFAHLDQH